MRLKIKKNIYNFRGPFHFLYAGFYQSLSLLRHFQFNIGVIPIIIIVEIIIHVTSQLLYIFLRLFLMLLVYQFRYQFRWLSEIWIDFNIFYSWIESQTRAYARKYTKNFYRRHTFRCECPSFLRANKLNIVQNDKEYDFSPHWLRRSKYLFIFHYLNASDRFKYSCWQMRSVRSSIFWNRSKLYGFLSHHWCRSLDSILDRWLVGVFPCVPCWRWVHVAA